MGELFLYEYISFNLCKFKDMMKSLTVMTSYFMKFLNNNNKLKTAITLNCRKYLFQQFTLWCFQATLELWFEAIQVMCNEAFTAKVKLTWHSFPDSERYLYGKRYNKMSEEKL